jgi:hypothetical protein
MGQPIDVFQPDTPSVTLNASTTSANVARTLVGGSTADVRIANVGTSIVYVAFGGASVTATVAAGMPLFPGAAEVFRMQRADQTYVAGITASGTSSLVITSGQGA